MSDANETADTVHDVGKAHLADNLRLMADNQRTLNRANAQDQKLRDLHVRTEEAMARDRVENLDASELATGDEDMRINVDSPTTSTVNHHYGPEMTPGPGIGGPVESVAKRNLLAKAAPLLLAGALGASGVGIPWLVAALGGTAVEAVVDTDTQYLLELVPGE